MIRVKNSGDLKDLKEFKDLKVILALLVHQDLQVLQAQFTYLQNLLSQICQFKFPHLQSQVLCYHLSIIQDKPPLLKVRKNSIIKKTAYQPFYFFWNSNNILTNSISYLGSNILSTTESSVQILVPRAGTIQSLSAHLKLSAGVNSARKFTLRKNGHNTDLFVILAGNNHQGSNKTEGVSVECFDLISIQHEVFGDPISSIAILNAELV